MTVDFGSDHVTLWGHEWFESSGEGLMVISGRVDGLAGWEGHRAVRC